MSWSSKPRRNKNAWWPHSYWDWLTFGAVTWPFVAQFDEANALAQPMVALVAVGKEPSQGPSQKAAGCLRLLPVPFQMQRGISKRAAVRCFSVIRGAEKGAVLQRLTLKATNLLDAIIVIASLVPQPPRTSDRERSHAPGSRAAEHPGLSPAACSLPVCSLSAAVEPGELPYHWSRPRNAFLLWNVWCLVCLLPPVAICYGVLAEASLHRLPKVPSISCTFPPVDQTGCVAWPSVMHSIALPALKSCATEGFLLVQGPTAHFVPARNF